MDVSPRKRTGADEEFEVPDSVVTSHQPSPDRFVFVERDNDDGWIATDLAVDLEP